MAVAVTVVIPTLDRAALVREALESLVRQSLDSWEALVIDDGSLDGTLGIVDEQRARSGRSHYLRRLREPPGASTCRNIGIENASGRYLILLDSDDLLAPYCLEQRVAFLEGRPDLDFATFPMLCFTKVPPGDGLLWNVLHDHEPGSEADLARFLSDDPPWQTAMPIWRREALTRVKWDEDALSWQDCEFHVQSILSELTYEKVTALPDCYLRRDSSPRMSSASLSAEAFWSRARSFRRIANRLDASRHASSQTASLFAGMLLRQAEVAATTSKSPALIAEFASQALDTRAAGRAARSLIWSYLACQRGLAASELPFVRGAFYRLARVVAPGWFGLTQTHYAAHRLSRKAVDSLRAASSAAEPALATVDWRRELTAGRAD